MKKSNVVLTALIGLLLVFGLVLAACDNGSTPSPVQYDSDPAVKLSDTAQGLKQGLATYTSLPQATKDKIDALIGKYFEYLPEDPETWGNQLWNDIAANADFMEAVEKIIGGSGE